MKKTLAIMLTLAMLVPLVLSMGTVAGAETVTVKPFYGLGWSEINRLKFPNLEDAPAISVKNNDGVVTLNYSGTDPATIAKKIKTKLDPLPEGMRHIRLFTPGNALKAGAELVVYVDNGIAQLKKVFTEFIEAYYALGGKLDGVILDTEYTAMGSWYLYTDMYGGLYNPKRPSFYNEIVAHPNYVTDIRPLLEEYGFKFYEKVGGNKAEIWSMFPPQYLSASERTKYAGCQAIWNRVMKIRQSRYFNDAVLTPLLARYPDAVMSDYQVGDTATWHKNLGSGGEQEIINSEKAGNTSNFNVYNGNPGNDFFVSEGNYLYQKPAGFNAANYEDDPYHMLVWNINKFKNMYDATDTKKISVWIAEYDYNSRVGSMCNTPYYTEAILHLGMLDPQPFLIYIYSADSKFKGTNGTAEYNKRMQTISEILNELTRVVGYSDRKPIQTPANWNDGYVLSGMYANGRNVWRLTPDTTEGLSLEDFKIKDNVPTFSINGTTIAFPQGRIIADGAVSVVGTGGYWIETPKNVMPVVTRDANRYSKYPAYSEDFSGYANGTVLQSANALPQQTWTVSGNPVVENGALAIFGTTVLNNVKLPANITAGDNYAKQQNWEISVTLPQAMSGGSVQLLKTPLDGGFKLEGGKVYYDENGSYKELSGVSLTAGKKYTLKREMNFNNDTCTYSVYSGTTLLKQAVNVKIKEIQLPVNVIGNASTALTQKLLLDDYKLYATGLGADLEVYDANVGTKLDAAAMNSNKSVAYRLSWMNASATPVSIDVRVAKYNGSGTLVSDSVLCSVNMQPGDDCVKTGIVENTSGGKVKVYLAAPKQVAPTVPTEAPTIAPITASTTVPATVPTTAPTTAPTTPTVVLPTVKPTVTTDPSVKPTVVPTVPTVSAPTESPTTQPSGETTEAPTAKPTETTTEPSKDAPTGAPTEDSTTAHTEGSAIAPTVAPITELTDVSPEPATTSDANKEGKGGNGGMVFVWIGIAVAVVAATAAGIIFYVKERKRPNG